VLDALEVSVLRPEILARVVERALVRHAEHRAAQPNRPAQLERELAAARAEIGRFVAAIGAGVDVAEIRGALEAAKVRAGTLEAELAGLAPRRGHPLFNHLPRLGPPPQSTRLLRA
jgi:hypothetical protein